MRNERQRLASNAARPQRRRRRRPHRARALIARIQQHLPPAPDWLLVGIGDDAAVVEPERNRVEVLSVDALVEGVHFDRAFVAARRHRPSRARGQSERPGRDGRGAAPRAAFPRAARPACRSTTSTRIVAGLARLAARHRIHVAGGNLTRSPGPLMIDITVVGHRQTPAGADTRRRAPGRRDLRERHARRRGGRAAHAAGETLHHGGTDAHGGHGHRAEPCPPCPPCPPW